jgi:hypothetical protein
MKLLEHNFASKLLLFLHELQLLLFLTDLFLSNPSLLNFHLGLSLFFFHLVFHVTH